MNKSLCLSLLSAFLISSTLRADYYDLINKGLTTIDPSFTKKYSYPLNEQSSQEAVNAACNRQQTYILQELKKAKSGSQARKQLVTTQSELSTACAILSTPKSRSEYAKKKGQIEREKEEERELAEARKKGELAFKAKQKEIEERKRTEKKAKRPKPGDPDYIPGMRGYLKNVFDEQKEGVGIKLGDLVGNLLSKINIPSVALKVFNNDLKLRDLRFLKAPIGFDVATGLGFTGTTQFNQFSVKATVYIVRDKQKNIQFSFSVQLPTFYKISAMFPAFKKVDLLSLPASELIASTFNYIDNAGFSVEKGFNFVARLNLEGPLRALGELRKKAKVNDSIVFDIEKPIYLQGLIASSSAMKLKAGIPLRLGIDFKKVKKVPKEFAQIIHKITTDDMAIGVAVTPTEHALNAQAGIGLYLPSQPKPFRIQAFGGIDVTSGKINFGGKLPDMLELRFIALGDATIELYIDPAVESILAFFGIPISGLGVGGRIDLGKPGEDRVSLSAHGKLSLEAKKAADFMFDIEGKNFKFSSLLRLLNIMAAKSGLKNVVFPLGKIPYIAVERVYGKFAPWDTIIGNELIEAGFKLTLDMQLFDKLFGFDVDIRHKDLLFSGAGYMPEVVLKDKGKIVFKLSGPGKDNKYGTPDDGPIISCTFNAKQPLKGGFKIATLLDIPPIDLKQKVDFEIMDKQFKTEFETTAFGFTTIFGVDIVPKKWKEMALTFGFKGDFKTFMMKLARGSLFEFKKQIISKLAKVNKTLEHMSAELEKLKQQQVKAQRGGMLATQEEIKKTEATIDGIKKRIELLKQTCTGALCPEQSEIIAQAAALAAQQAYLNVLLKPGRAVIYGSIELLNKLNEAVQKVGRLFADEKKTKERAEKILNGITAALEQSLEIFEITEAKGVINMKDLAEGKLPELSSLKATVNIPGVPPVHLNFINIQFDFKQPSRSAVGIVKRLLGGIKVG